LADAEARREEDGCESMASLSVLSYSRASHQPVRISKANLPQCAELLRSLLVDKTRKWSRQSAVLV